MDNENKRGRQASSSSKAEGPFSTLMGNCPKKSMEKKKTFCQTQTQMESKPEYKLDTLMEYALGQKISKTDAAKWKKELSFEVLNVTGNEEAISQVIADMSSGPHYGPVFEDLKKDVPQVKSMIVARQEFIDAPERLKALYYIKADSNTTAEQPGPSNGKETGSSSKYNQ
ncbi:hypothetical protein CRE_22390 [Caenorhabditis remanei]|uniref:Uncharacterized protein n=1 Tax=Caenorhabditis remanei TaxID=31234 RepID=E3MDW0_CAERE|nr:hypothetical protein CRE_22390 [Caenorhabditis remanei]